MRSTTVLNLLGAILLAAFLMSCAPSPVYKLTSLDDEMEFERGREFVTKEDESIATSIEFEDYTEDYYVFYVQVYNKSDKPYTFHPQHIMIERLNRDLKPFHNRKFTYAVNPEVKLAMLDEEIKNRESWHAAATGINIAVGVLGVLSEIIDDDDDDDAYEVAEDIAIFADNQISEEVSYDIDKADLNSQKEFWKNEVLRKTTLHKDEQIGGLVFIPFNEINKYIKIEIPADENSHAYAFKQIQIN